MNDLLPCPFCGSDKITIEWEPCPKLDEADTTRRWFAECTQCSCQGPFCQKEPQVIPAWNKRTENLVKRSALENLYKVAILFTEHPSFNCDFQIVLKEAQEELQRTQL